MKICSKCKTYKRLGKFPRDKQKKDGLYSSCKDCHSVRSRLYGSENKIKIQNANLKRQYGITLKEYNRLSALQNNVCAICKNSTDRNLAVDHCHTTKKIRGLLCTRCNPGIGYFLEDPQLLLSAIKYLEVHNGS